MRKLIILTLAALCLALQPMSAQKKEGNDNYKYYKAVEILEEDGDPRDAKRLAMENIEDNPKHIDSYLLVAGIYRGDGDYANALGVIEQAMENNHRNSGISTALLTWWKGIIYGEIGNFGRAVETVGQAVKLARKTDKEHLISMMENLAQFHYDLKDYDASDKVYREIMGLDESALLPRIGLARNMNARERYDDALSILNECLKYDKDYSEIYRFQVQSYEGKKEYKKMIDAMLTLYDKTGDVDFVNVDRLKKDRRYSIAVLKERIASEKDPLMKIVLASLYEECNMYASAIPLLDEMVEEYGLHEDLLDERADCYDEMGMVELALADIDAALEMCNESDEAYFHMRRGEILRYAGQYRQAIEDMSKYVDRYPTDAYGYYARGWCKELLGDLVGALQDYDEGIAVDEDYPYIYLMRGNLYLEIGENEKAMADLETVVAKDTVADGGSCRHYALHQLGESEEAVQWMEKIIGLYGDDPGQWYDKACLYARMGRGDEAVEALKISFEKGYRGFPHIENDDDVDSIRDREDFKSLVEQYKLKLAEEIRMMKPDIDEAQATSVSEVAMKKMYGGTYEVPCSVNGLPLRMIFDTGASDVTISSVEANFMLKNGYLVDDDVRGKRNYITASGDIHEGTILRLKEVRLGDAVLKNVEASVVHSQKAPLLLGQSVLEKFGTITIDNVNSKLLIKQ